MSLVVTVATVSVSRLAGGLFESVRHSSLAMRRQGAEVRVLGLEDAHSREDRAVWRPIEPEVFPSLRLPGIRWSSRLGRRLQSNPGDLIHIHGLWQFPSIANLWNHRRRGTPYLISPRGMLDSWALRNSGWKKRLAGKAFEDCHLNGASCLHALCASEAAAMRDYGLRGPVAIIPNGVEFPKGSCERSGVADPQFYPGRSRSSREGRKRLLFLGRLHAKKGLEVGLAGLARLRETPQMSGMAGGWQMIIAGWDQNGHESELRKQCETLGLTVADVSLSTFKSTADEPVWPDSAVVFVGSVYGAQKDNLLRCVHAFILPSFSEGLPMSVLEAWSYGLPAVITYECNLPEGFAAGAAVPIGDVNWKAIGRDQQGQGVFEALATLFSMSDFDREEMGKQAVRLVRERFTWERVAGQMLQTYRWILEGGAAPPFVSVA